MVVKLFNVNGQSLGEAVIPGMVEGEVAPELLILEELHPGYDRPGTIYNAHFVLKEGTKNEYRRLFPQYCQRLKV